MIGRITNYLPSFSRTQESSEDDDEESYESASSGGLFEDSQSDIEPTRDSPDVQKKTREGLLSSAVQNSVYPPLSSIGTQATTESVASVAVGSAESNLLSSHIKEGFFVDLDPADSFVQSSPLVQSAGGKKMSNSSKGNLQFLASKVGSFHLAQFEFSGFRIPTWKFSTAIALLPSASLM